MSRSPSLFAPLTGLRAVAALWVVAFHFLPVADGTAVQTAVRHGYLGVGLFFALSGFLLGYRYILPEGTLRSPVPRYLWGRVARLYPVYLLSLALGAPFFVSGLVERNGVLLGLAKLGLSLGTHLSLTQALTPVTATLWNVAAWSLSVEAAFYVAFPLAVPWLARQRRLLAPLALLYVGALVAPGLLTWLDPGASAHSTGMAVRLLKFFPLFHLPTFLAGAVLGRWFQGREDGGLPRHRVLLAYLGLAGVAGVLASGRAPYLMLHDGLLLPFLLALILGLTESRSALARVLGARWMVRLGEASYAIYILQFPVKKAYVHLAGPIETGTAFSAYAVVLVAVSLAAYRYVERPAQRWLNARGPGRGSAAPASPERPNTAQPPARAA